MIPEEKQFYGKKFSQFMIKKQLAKNKKKEKRKK